MLRADAPAAARRIVVLHGDVPPDAPPDEQDTLIQVREVSAALAALGYEAIPVGMTLALEPLRERLRALAPAAVFNLVEALAGQDGLLALAPLLLESLAIPYTGARPAALVASGDKREAKRVLRRARIPTPALWGEPGAGAAAGGEWIVKSVTQQASFGLDEASIVPGAQVPARLRECQARLGGAWFAEAFVPGREFNLSLLERGATVALLPPAEIRFQAPPGTPAGSAPRIVGYAAKWDPASPEYRATERSFEFAAEDRPLLARLGRLARRCWDAFGLNGAARVDFRVDPHGTPWVLEVNANPCLASDAGFAAAAARAGIGSTALIATILRGALTEDAPAGAGPSAAHGAAPRALPGGR